jgi:hypothetical protein
MLIIIDGFHVKISAILIFSFLGSLREVVAAKQRATNSPESIYLGLTVFLDCVVLSHQSRKLTK